MKIKDYFIVTAIIMIFSFYSRGQISVTNPINCNGASTGALMATPSGWGSPPYTYFWNTGDFTQSIVNLIAGNYSVTITDSLGIDSVFSLILGQPPLLVATINPPTHVSCFNGYDGTATVVPSGGTSPYTYNWSNGTNNISATSLSSGNYSVTVTDNFGCTASNSVIITEPAQLNSSFSGVVNVSCNGGTNGSATITGNGGTPGYTYNWSNGSVTSVNNNLIAGMYTVTITDLNGCTTFNSINISQPNVLTATISSQNVSCFSGNNGSATVTPSGGTSPYSYIWSNGNLTNTINNLIAGLYSVTITDNRGCTTVASTNISQPALLSASITSLVNVSCYNGNNGSATVSPSGGTGPYTYNWSNGSNNATANGLTSGTYLVTVTDSKGCTANNTAIIIQPPQLISTIFGIVNVSCNGGSNGSATISAAGGTPGYTFNWSNGSTNPTIFGLSAGNYNVTVTDNIGCTIGNSVVISQPALLNLVVVDQQNVSCFGGNNGSVTVDANGGMAPYSYLWSNGGTTNTINNLTTGIYSLTVIDNALCTNTIMVNIAQPAPLIINTVLVNPSDCDGHNNGEAQISISGGVSPYAYLWREINFDSIYTTQNIDSVRGGDYLITVTDMNNCIAFDTIIIPNMTAVAVTVTYPPYICNGAQGSVSILADNADSAQYYTYQWNSTYNSGIFVTNDSVFSTGTSFLAGNYTITITENATGCAEYFNFTIDQSATPLVVSSTVMHNQCFGNNNGSIRLYVNGGDPLPTNQVVWTGPYGFTSTSFIISALVSGDYHYTVTDDGACSVQGTIRILPLTPLQGYTSKNDVSCFGGSNGSILAYYSGGSGTIKYLWSNGDTIPQLMNLVAGMYSLTVTDSLGCAKYSTVQIIEPPALVTILDLKQDVSCFGFSDGLISTTTTGGSGTLHYSWLLNGSLFPEVTNNLINIPAGDYHLTVTDSLFCTSSLDVTVLQPTQTLFTDSIHVISCNNGSDGYWEITPTGAYTPYIAIFSTGDTISTDTVPSPYISGLIAGSYYCHIIASNGCEWDFTASFTQPLPITVGLSNIVPVVCYSDSTGSITLNSVHGGTPPYTYAWSNGTNSNPLVNVPNGIYHVTITDSKNCTLEETYIVDQPYEPIKFFPTVTATSCQQAEDGQVVVYQEDVYWSPYINMIYLYDSLLVLVDSGGTGHFFGGLPPGPYSLILINEMGCSVKATVYIAKGSDDCILIPNLVTPNGDGYNDVFRVQGGCEYETFHISIYTDLGKNVFESDDCNFTWDPRETQKASPNTVFFYYIKVTEGKRTYEFRNSINVNY